MNGRTHAAIGAASMAGAALSGVPLTDCAMMAAISAGFSLGPDIDTPESTASRSMPAVVHRTAHRISHHVRTQTSTYPWDTQYFQWKISHGHDPEHRALTHTVVFGVAVTGVCVGASFFLGTLPVMFLAAWWCHRLSPYLVPVLILMVVASAMDPLPCWMVTWAVGVGWLSHIIADGCTTSGVPALWPLMVRRKRWYRVRLLGSSLKSGDSREWIAGAAVSAMMNLPMIVF